MPPAIPQTSPSRDKTSDASAMSSIPIPMQKVTNNKAGPVRSTSALTMEHETVSPAILHYPNDAKDAGTLATIPDPQHIANIIAEPLPTLPTSPADCGSHRPYQTLEHPRALRSKADSEVLGVSIAFLATDFLAEVESKFGHDVDPNYYDVDEMRTRRILF